MFWKTVFGGDRRKSGQRDRDRFDQRRRDLERDPDRVEAMRRLEFLEAESSLWLQQSDGTIPKR